MNQSEKGARIPYPTEPYLKASPYLLKNYFRFNIQPHHPLPTIQLFLDIGTRSILSFFRTPRANEAEIMEIRVKSCHTNRL